jgi:hypothetical protein
MYLNPSNIHMARILSPYPFQISKRLLQIRSRTPGIAHRSSGRFQFRRQLQRAIFSIRASLAKFESTAALVSLMASSWCFWFIDRTSDSPSIDGFLLISSEGLLSWATSIVLHFSSSFFAMLSQPHPSRQPLSLSLIPWRPRPPLSFSPCALSLPPHLSFFLYACAGRPHRPWPWPWPTGHAPSLVMGPVGRLWAPPHPIAVAEPPMAGLSSLPNVVFSLLKVEGGWR